MDYRRASHTLGTVLAGGAGPDPGQRRQENIERFEANAAWTLAWKLHWDETDGQVNGRNAAQVRTYRVQRSGQVRGEEHHGQAAGCLKRWFRQNCIRKRAETMEDISWALCSMVALTSEETCIYEGKDIPSSNELPGRLGREAMQRPHGTGQAAPSPFPAAPLSLAGLVPWVPGATPSWRRCGVAVRAAVPR